MCLYLPSCTSYAYVCACVCNGGDETRARKSSSKTRIKAEKGTLNRYVSNLLLMLFVQNQVDRSLMVLDKNMTLHMF